MPERRAGWRFRSSSIDPLRLNWPMREVQECAVLLELGSFRPGKEFSQRQTAR